MVHDFMWAADPEYVHDTLQMQNGVTLHFLYKNDEKYKETWEKVQPLTEKAMEFFNKNIGDIPISNTPLFKVVMAVWSMPWQR